MATTEKQDNAFGRAMLDYVIGWISENLEPQDVFDDGQLDDWASNNDYTKGE